MKVIKIIFIIMGLLVMMYAIGSCAQKSCPTYTTIKDIRTNTDQFDSDTCN